MKFSYNGISTSGDARSGTISAVDHDAAIAKLQNKGIYITDIHESTSKNEKNKPNVGLLDEISALLPIKNSQKIFFFRQFALMLRSGLSVTEGLNILRGIQRGGMLRIIDDMNDQISAGRSFSQAMEKHEAIFTPLALHMIRSAEASGELEPALVRIASFMERQAEIKSQLISTMTYPAVVLFMTVGVFIFLMSTVIPKFAAFFAKTGRVPPPEMLQMMGISNFIHQYWWLIIVCIIAILVSIFITYRQPKGRLFLDLILLKMPLIGKMISASSMSQITWGLTSMLQSGISVVQSLQIISSLINNKMIARDISQAAEDILCGDDMGKSFRKPHIEGLIQEMTLVGERTGNMVQVMQDAGSFYEERVRSITKALAAAMEPISILMIGGIVGYVYYGFFKSMFAVSG
ncbi:MULTISPECIES: type II secretion system F family protein [unclassified Neptuniibacter]|jgi:type IV pilus assembly protein PilC|uniref:type II secretion system F family protein n=1 Tax=unclassified Neptuniibacter TaxID=2630693 RepID=UPI0026E3A982|nr:MULTISPECIES: type II secretion system F family protein [unclassified Neptuniibacter]MDO6512614.1 type II secretion system F family protein [Neptuniibacter sp. 2_MG-2023]MDO6593551.1 type II secretion system F family protein [Neptuniibacter sp. 1_MG-2023]